jgi:hypothetical protein
MISPTRPEASTRKAGDVIKDGNMPEGIMERAKTEI